MTDDLAARLASLPTLSTEEHEALARDPNAPAALLKALALRVPVAVWQNPALPLLEAGGEWLWRELADEGVLFHLAQAPNVPLPVVEWVIAEALRPGAAPRVRLVAVARVLLLNEAVPLPLRDRLRAVFSWLRKR